VASVALIIIFITAVVIKHLFFWQPMDVSHFYANGPLKMGHRGSPKNAPENTLPSYKQAVRVGLKAIEMDVVTTKDGFVVCSHNHDLERETDGFGYIHEMTLDELRRIDAGKKFPQFSPSKIPLLEEAVEAVPDDVLLNIEIKAAGALDLGTVRYVADIIQRRNLYGRVMVSSFHPLVIGWMKRLNSRVPTAYIWTDDNTVPKILRKPRFINLVHPDMLNLEAHLLDDYTLTFTNRKGMKINAWTVNSQPAMEWLLRKGADGIISNYPELMHKAVSKAGETDETV
jgi:glycerophosphoryl diester phosphodiesterase|tara:strand:- start:1892 stop:2746 length:855 start_codon:yes stop_codon:yes gene_type:complete